MPAYFYRPVLPVARTDMPKKDTIKVGNIVRIVNPVRMIRCGYPLDLTEVKNRIVKDNLQRICDFLGIQCNVWKKEIRENFHPNDWRAIHLVAQAMARVELRTKQFGGKERTIHSEELSWLSNKLIEVSAIKTCVTGSYYSPYAGNDYDDYESGGLTDPKHHRYIIGRLTGPGNIYDHENPLRDVHGCFTTELKIQIENVEKIADSYDLYLQRRCGHAGQQLIAPTH